MHELTLAFDLIDKAETVLSQENGVRATQVEIVIGEMSGVDREAFCFAFPEAARGTRLDGAELVIIEASGREFQFRSLEVCDV